MAGERSEVKKGSPQITSDEREHTGSRRDPEERSVEGENAEEQHRIRERAHDKTLADSFPTSDPPSSIPDPGESDSDAA